MIQIRVVLEQCLPMQSWGVTVYIMAHSLQTIWRENFIKEYHAAPSKIHKIIEELQYDFSLQYKKT